VRLLEEGPPLRLLALNADIALAATSGQRDLEGSPQVAPIPPFSPSNYSARNCVIFQNGGCGTKLPLPPGGGESSDGGGGGECHEVVVTHQKFHVFPVFMPLWNITSIFSH